MKFVFLAIANVLVQAFVATLFWQEDDSTNNGKANIIMSLFCYNMLP